MKKQVPARVTWLLMAAAAAACLFGAARGEAAIIFKKAATICMECIGLG